MRIALIVLALAVCATVFWLMWYEPQGVTRIDSPVLVDAGSQLMDEPLSDAGEGSWSGKSASGARTAQGQVQGYLVDVAGRAAGGVAYGIERHDVLTSVGHTAKDGAWALEVDLASLDEDPAGPVCVFTVNANVDMAFRLSRSSEPLSVALPKLADAHFILDDHNEGETWKVYLTPKEKRVDLHKGREVRLSGTRVENRTDRYRFTSLAGAMFGLEAYGSTFQLKAHDKTLKLPGTVLLRKGDLFPRVKLLIVGEDDRVQPVTGQCVLRLSASGSLDCKLREGVVDLGAWRRLGWNRDFSIFVLLSDGEYFDHAFKTPRLPTHEIQEIRLRKGEGRQTIVVSGFKGRQPASAMFEQSSGQWLGISSLEASGGDTRGYGMRPTGEVDVILMPKGWRRIFFFYRDGDIASCDNTGRPLTQVRFLETSELMEQNLLSLFKELRIKGPCVVYYEVLLPGLVKSKEWWRHVDSLRLEATGLRKGKAIIWRKKLPIGMVSRLRFQLVGQPATSDRFVRPNPR